MSTRFYLNSGSGLTSMVEVSRNPSSDPVRDFGFENRNKLRKWKMSHQLESFSIGSRSIRGTLKLEWLSYQEALSLINFFANTIDFTRAFGLETDAQIDLGMGLNNALSLCFLQEGIKSTDQLIFSAGKGNRFTLELPYISHDLNTLQGALF